MKTYNIQLIFDNNEDKQSLIKSLSLKKDAFNIISKIRFGMKTCNGLMPLHQRCYKIIRDEFPSIPSQFVIKTEQDVCAKYKSLRSNFHKITEPVETDRLNIQLDTRIYTWVDDTHNAIKLTTCNGRITAKLSKYDKSNELFSKYKLKDPSLFVKDNDVFLSVVFDDTVPFQDNKQCIGVDLGLKRLVSTSEGIIIKGNEFNKTKRKIRWNKRKLQDPMNHNQALSLDYLHKYKHRTVCHVRCSEILV